MHTALTVAVFVFLAALPSKADPAALWSKKCKSCHGLTGDADTRMGKRHNIQDMTDARWQDENDDDAVRKVIVEGQKGTKMKAYGRSLTQEQIDDLVKHIRSLRRKD